MGDWRHDELRLPSSRKGLALTRKEILTKYAAESYICCSLCYAGTWCARRLTTGQPVYVGTLGVDLVTANGGHHVRGGRLYRRAGGGQLG